MDIDTHLPRYLEELEWEYPTICHDYEVVTVIRSELIEKFCILSDLRRLQYWDIVRDCELFHRARSHHLITTERLIRIGYDEYHLDIWS